MAKLKIWMVALTLITGVSFTSCLNGDDNTIQPVYGPILLKSTFPYQFQAEGSDVVFEANSVTITGLSDNAYAGDMVYLDAQYDTSTQVVDENTKKIIVTVTKASKMNENTYISLEDVTYNRSVLSTLELGANYSPGLYSKNWLIFPISFYIEKSEMASALKHSFYLVYDAEHEDNNETTMVLRLRHQSNEDASKETSFALLSKAFKITGLVSNFNGGSTTNKLKTIKIIIQQQKGKTPEILEGSTDSYTEYTYELDYSKVADL